MKRIKKAVCTLMILCFLLSSASLSISAMNIHTAIEGFSDVIVSEDGKYQYVIKEETGELYLVGSLEENITVLNIPEEIDGKPVVATDVIYSDSSGIIKINFPSSIKTTLLRKGLIDKKAGEADIPICTINYNNGIETVDDIEDSFICYLDNYADGSPSLIRLKLLILPECLKKLKEWSIDAAQVGNIIIPDGTSLDAFSVTTDGFDEYEDRDYYYFKEPCSIFFVGNALNADPLAFCHTNYYGDIDYDFSPYYSPSLHISIYKKPDTEGFERFSGTVFKEALMKAQDEINEKWSLHYEADIANKKLRDYTVKEYTDEWWKDIKEIQSVEISGEGVTLKKDSKGKGTVTELGWSPSNDPAQYLSREYELSAKPGDSFTLKSSFAPADAFDDRTFFVSLNEDVATVDTESGKVTVLKEGTATIRCVAASGVFSDCFIYSGSAAQTQAQVQEKSDSLKAKAHLIIISCSCAAILVAGVVIFTVKKKRR